MENELYSSSFDPNTASLPVGHKPNYRPNPNIKFGFIAGIEAFFGQESLVSIAVQMEMAFNNNWGLNYIGLTGFGAFMTDKPQDGGAISAAMSARYDRENSSFHSVMEISADIYNVITVRRMRAEIYTSPDKWFFNLGKMDDPANVSIVGLLSAKSYFMAGSIPNSLPPLNPRITALFGRTQSDAIEQSADFYDEGKGFAFGVSLEASCGFGQKKGFVFAYIDLLGGTDALVITEGVTCPDISWRGYAQAYIYFDGAAGVRVRRKHTIVQLTVAAALEAQFPAPYYISGDLAFRYRVLFVKGKIKRSYSTGRQC
jgi:hypothetical protein